MTFTRDGSERVRCGVAVIAGFVLVSLAVGSCSSDDGDDGASGTSSTQAPASSTSTTVDRPDGPVADLSEELTGGDGIYIGAAEASELEGYEEREYVAAGTASSYSAAGELAADGEWTFEPDASADYRTRVIVRRPADVADASGTVLVEWLNVSGGVDADPEFVTFARGDPASGPHVGRGVRTGHRGRGWSGGGPRRRARRRGRGQGPQGPRPGALRRRWSTPATPSRTTSSRRSRGAVRAGGPAIGELEPSSVVAVGESQSAFALVTYVNGVQPLTKAFDGFFVHSRGASGLGLSEPGKTADIASSIGGTKTTFRTDTEVPVFNVQTENDVVGVFSTAVVRQPDTDRFRLWEVPGTAHADLHLVGESTAEVVDCGVPINDGPFHVVAKAALRHLVGWVEGGEPPPEAPPLEVTEGDAPEMLRDPDGIALGGVRTPPVDVPVRVLSGMKGPEQLGHLPAVGVDDAPAGGTPRRALPLAGGVRATLRSGRRRGDRCGLRPRRGPRGAPRVRPPRARHRLTRLTGPGVGWPAWPVGTADARVRGSGRSGAAPAHSADPRDPRPARRAHRPAPPWPAGGTDEPAGRRGSGLWAARSTGDRPAG